MATIKAFSDLQQSKKLAEILPIESADMCYVHTIDIEGDEHYDIDFRNNQPLFEDDVCAWSLATLLELLPKRLEIVDNVYKLNVYFYGFYYWNVVNGNLCFASKDNDNLVDACYEMIIMLSENGLI
jgi:hypothetical protein